MWRFASRSLGYLVGVWALLGGLTACRPAARLRLQGSVSAWPNPVLLALSVADGCIIAVDPAQRQVVGTLRSPFLHASTDLVALPSGEVVVTLDADADHDYREIVWLNLQQGRETARVTVDWAPVRLGLAPQGFLLVGHALEKSSNGRFTLSILSLHPPRLLTTAETDGYVSDMTFAATRAYLAVTAVRPGVASGVLVYDLAKQRVEAFYPLPQRAGAPPASPASLALVAEQQRLYAVWFQFAEEAPCQQRGQLAQLDLTTGEWTVVLDLADVGPLLALSEGTLLIGEQCSWGQGRLLLVDPTRGEVLQTWQVGPGLQDLHWVDAHTVAVSVMETHRLAFYDTQAKTVGQQVDTPCVWPTALTLLRSP